MTRLSVSPYVKKEVAESQVIHTLPHMQPDQPSQKLQNPPGTSSLQTTPVRTVVRKILLTRCHRPIPMEYLTLCSKSWHTSSIFQGSNLNGGNGVGALNLLSTEITQNPMAALNKT